MDRIVERLHRADIHLFTEDGRRFLGGEQPRWLKFALLRAVERQRLDDDIPRWRLSICATGAVRRFDGTGPRVSGQAVW